MSRLALDIGGTKVVLRIEDGTRPAAESKLMWPHPTAGVEADMAILAAALDQLKRDCGAPDRRVEAVGVAMPATVDQDGVVTAWPNRPSWIGTRLVGAFAALAPGASVRWADDGDLAGLAEAGAAGLENVVYLGVGTGIGGGIVVRGQLMPGTRRGSAEVGHMVVDRSGPVCGCGRRGCLQAVASGPATLSRAGRLLGRDVDYPSLQIAWQRRDAWATQALTESSDALAAAAVSLAEVLHPDAVVIGGGFVAGIPDMVGLIAEGVRRWARPGVTPPPIRAATLGALSSLHGAMLLARMPGGPRDADVSTVPADDR